MLAVIWWLNALPTVPLAVAALLITGAWAKMRRVKDWFPEPPPFVALMVTVALPAALGVPLIRPLVAFSDNPLGRVPVIE